SPRASSGDPRTASGPSLYATQPSFGATSRRQEFDVAGSCRRSGYPWLHDARAHAPTGWRASATGWRGVQEVTAVVCLSSGRAGRLVEPGRAAEDARPYPPGAVLGTASGHIRTVEVVGQRIRLWAGSKAHPARIG